MNAGKVSPPRRVSDTDMRHSTCAMYVPWCMPWSLTSVSLCKRYFRLLWLDIIIYYQYFQPLWTSHQLIQIKISWPYDHKRHERVHICVDILYMNSSSSWPMARLLMFVPFVESKATNKNMHWWGVSVTRVSLRLKDDMKDTTSYRVLLKE